MTQFLDKATQKALAEIARAACPGGVIHVQKALRFDNSSASIMVNGETVIVPDLLWRFLDEQREAISARIAEACSGGAQDRL